MPGSFAVRQAKSILIANNPTLKVVVIVSRDYTKVNAYVTINRGKNAGLKPAAEDTPEFYPYEDRPLIRKA